jgi:hypothetical protein
MAHVVRKLSPGEVVIGLMTLSGKRIGELTSPDVGHDELSSRVPGLRARLAAGQAIGITLMKTKESAIKVFAPGYFPHPMERL